MRIAYLGQMADVASENGISKKIRGQMTRWTAAGHTVRYFALTPTRTVWRGLTGLDFDVLARGGAALRLWRSLELTRRIAAWRPDAIYFRYGYHEVGLPGLFRQIPTIAEINSDDQAEYPLTLSRTKQLYHRATRSRLLRTVSGFVPVTHELAGRFAWLGRPTEVIANGIDLDCFPASPPPGFGTPPRMIFIGSEGTPWHGLERVAELGRMLPHVTFDIVGCKTPSSPGAPANLCFQGPLSAEDYQPLLDRATAAIGTLALYRKRMDEACPLKVREYLAAGLPVIAGYRDTDVPDSADYFLRLPNSAAPLAGETDRITQWLQHWRSRRVPRDAIAHIGDRAKEERRLTFIATITAAAKRP